MTCEELRDSYELYSLGLLPDDQEKREIEEHLGRNCTACQKSLKDALSVNALMLSQAPEVVPPSRLRRRVMASVGIERSGWGWLAALAAACALIVALWLGIQNRTTDRRLAETREALRDVADQRNLEEQIILDFLNQPETRQVNFGKDQPTQPRGNFFLNPRVGVLLVASNLPKRPAGKRYEMWLIPKGGAPRPAGLFGPNPGGTAWTFLPGPVDSNVTMAVTIEPEAGSPAPTSGILFSAGF